MQGCRCTGPKARFCLGRYTYERKGIQDWLKMKDTSPMTNEPMESKDLVPNRALRAIIRVLYAPN